MCSVSASKRAIRPVRGRLSRRPGAPSGRGSARGAAEADVDVGRISSAVDGDDGVARGVGVLELPDEGGLGPERLAPWFGLGAELGLQRDEVGAVAVDPLDQVAGLDVGFGMTLLRASCRNRPGSVSRTTTPYLCRWPQRTIARCSPRTLRARPPAAPLRASRRGARASGPERDDRGVDHHEDLSRRPRRQGPLEPVEVSAGRRRRGRRTGAPSRLDGVRGRSAGPAPPAREERQQDAVEGLGRARPRDSWFPLVAGTGPRALRRGPRPIAPSHCRPAQRRGSRTSPRQVADLDTNGTGGPSTPAADLPQLVEEAGSTSRVIRL